MSYPAEVNDRDLVEVVALKNILEGFEVDFPLGEGVMHPNAKAQANDVRIGGFARFLEKNPLTNSNKAGNKLLHLCTAVGFRKEDLR